MVEASWRSGSCAAARRRSSRPNRRPSAAAVAAPTRLPTARLSVGLIRFVFQRSGKNGTDQAISGPLVRVLKEDEREGA